MLRPPFGWGAPPRPPCAPIDAGQPHPKAESYTPFTWNSGRSTTMCRCSRGTSGWLADLMRADARRNRELLLDAAVDAILEAGGEPARDALAKRAGVGIATLYRHFPDQQALLHAVAVHVLDRTIADGEALLDTAQTGADALREYMHCAVDNGLGVLNLVYPLLDDVNWPERRQRADALLNGIVDRAKREGTMRPDATVQDVGFAVIRACRPLAVGLPPDDERMLAHRHIDIYVDGLVADRPPT
jgi:AcrR family transcriptional regulator